MAKPIERGKNRFLVRVFLGRDPATGKVQYHNRTIHGSEKDAVKYARDVQVKVDKGEFFLASKETLGAYLDRWLKHKQGKIAGNTHEHYTENLTRYIRPQLGGFRISELQAIDIQKLYDGLSERLSPRTVRYAHSVLSAALKQAVKWKLISFNPAGNGVVDLPKRRPKEMQAIASADAPRFLAAAREDRYFALFVLMLETGLRPSECFALLRTDINFDSGDVTVQKKLIWKRDGTYYVGEPKTASSRRSVPLSQKLVVILKHHLSSQAEERLKSGPDKYKDRGFLFAGIHGEPLREHNIIARHFKPTLKRAKLPKTLRVYDLRHSCATVALEAGENPKVVSERLGHSSVTLTLDVYSHVTPTLQKNATRKIANRIFGAESHSSHTGSKRRRK